MEIRDIPADINALQVGDWVAFPWNYYGGPNAKQEDQEIMVAQLVYANHGRSFGVNFLYGYQSLSEDLRPEHIIAIGSQSGKEKIKLYSGHYGFHILQPEHPVFLKHQEEYKDR